MTNIVRKIMLKSHKSFIKREEEPDLKKCPECGTKLVKGEIVKEPDETKYFELTCPNARKDMLI